MSDEEMVRKYSDMVYRIAFNYARNNHDADDIFSEVFLKYFKRKRFFANEEHRKAWLIKVTINCAKDFFAKQTHNADIDDVGIEMAVYDKTDTGDVLDAIKKLDEESRNIVYLFYYEQISLKDIAKTLNLNENTVKTKLSRARKKLATLLEDYNK